MSRHKKLKMLSIILLPLLCSMLLHAANGQQSVTNCSNFLRSVHRRGSNMRGRLEIPTDEQYPNYKVKIGFSSPIHHMTIGQMRAKDSGTHQEFVVDPMDMQQDGKLLLDVFIKLRRRFGPFGAIPRVTRIIYNNVALCGSPVSDSEMDGSVVLLATTPTISKSTVPVTVPTNKTRPEKGKDYEDEEEIF